MIKPEISGWGLGLRPPHYHEILETLPPIDFFEILSENYMIQGGKPLYFLDKIREHYPMVMHGVSLSIGSTDPLNWEYLKELKALVQRVNPVLISDHLCWTGVNGLNMHDLLPLPYTEEALKHVIERVIQVQDYLERHILLENVSSYITFKESIFTEWEFLTLIAEEADCHILLDLNNIYVSGFNHKFDPIHYINSIPTELVKQFHLAGHTHNGDHIIDTHNTAIIDPVWELYAAAIQRFGLIPTIVERDDNIPPLNELLSELNQAKKIAHENLTYTLTNPECVS